MRITREDNPDMAKWFVPWFIMADEPLDDVYLTLIKGMRDRPDKTFCAVASENGFIQAILVAYDEGSHVWVAQAQARRGFRYSRFMFEGLLSWAASRGCEVVKCGTLNPRVAVLLTKRYKFETEDVKDGLYRFTRNVK